MKNVGLPIKNLNCHTQVLLIELDYLENVYNFFVYAHLPDSVERAEYDFCSRRQGVCESVSDSLTMLCTLLIDCDTLNLNTTNAKMLDDHNLAVQLAIGCYNQQTLEKLLKDMEINLEQLRRHHAR